MAYDADDKLKFGWDVIERAVSEVCLKMDQVEYSPSTIIAIAKGGVIPASLIHQRFPLAKFKTITAASYTEDNEQRPRVDLDLNHILHEQLNYSSTLFVDDLVDTGDTFIAVKQILGDAKFAALFLKPPKGFLQGEWIRAVNYVGMMLPTSRWVVFPWEV